MEKLVDEKLYTGAVEQEWDERHRVYDDQVMAVGAIDIDWDKGFDIRNRIGGHIPFKDQKTSLSCVGQGWAYQQWIFNVIELITVHGMTFDEIMEKYPTLLDEISAKAIYSQIYLANGGAYIMNGAKLAVEWGALYERIVPSNKKDGSADEDFMRDKSWKNDNLDLLAQVLRGKEYRIIRVRDNMDLYAQAILENHGVVGGVKGQNGKGWGNSERPLPPDSVSDVDWSHCLYFGAFGKDEKGKFIATPNSWGERSWNKGYVWKPGDPIGEGWQKLYEDYFTKDFQFDPWTYTDILNINLETMDNEFVRILKDEDSKAVGFWLPATSPDALVSLAKGFNKNIYKKEDGNIDWDKTIEGTVKLEYPAEQ